MWHPFHRSRLSLKERKRVTTHLTEFFIIGVAMGIVEDMLAIYFATDDDITWRTFKVAVLVALPFAVISEIVVDMKLFHRLFKKK